MKRLRWRVRQRISSWLLISILLYLPACATPGGVSGPYKPTIPTLLAEPIRSGCTIEDAGGALLRTTCVTVAERDWNAVVTELKAACLALGHSRGECKAEN